ncbi:MAG: hypothetical protein PVI90_16730 [Desulfobacteraceae bacterium]|jgi:chromosome segregation ATPase
MPSKHYSEKFRYDLDDYGAPEDLPEDAFRDDIRELKLEKLSHRVTLITILIPILIVVIIVVSYLDIKQKVVQTQTTGTMGVQNLSKDLESRFSSLSVRQAKLEDSLQKQQKKLEKDWAEYAVERKNLKDKITNLSKGKANRKELNETTEQFNTTLRTIQEELATTHTNLDTVEAAATKSLNQVITLKEESLQKFDKLSKNTSTLAEKKLDRSQLDIALKIRDLRLQEQYQEQTKSLENEIAALKKKSDQISKELSAALDEIKELSNSQPTQQTQTKSSPPKTTSPAPAPTPTPKEGKIVEQDLN